MIDPPATDLSDVADWFDAHAPACRLYARQWLDPAAADDAVQEAFVRLIGLQNPPDSPRAWLFAAVRHLALTAVRSDGRRRARERSTGGALRAGDFAPSPEGAVDARLAADALGDLPPRQREAVVLRLWGHLGYADAARVAGVSLATAHADYAAAIAALRRRLDPDHRTVTSADRPARRPSTPESPCPTAT